MNDFDLSPGMVDLQWFAEPDNSDAESTGAEAGSETAVQGSGDANEFLSDLPESLRGSKSLAKFSAKADLAQSYVYLESKLGKSVEIPGKDASPEVWEKFYSRIGRPKTADEYKLSPSLGYKSDPVFDAAFRKSAHQSGLSANAAAGIYAEVTRRMAENESALEAELSGRREVARKALHAQFGESLEGELPKARKAYDTIFSPESRAALKATGLEDHPALIADLIKAAKAFGVDRMVEGKPPTGNGKTMDTRNPGHPYAYMRETSR